MKTIDKNKIIEILEDMNDDDLLSIWNEYASENGYNNIYNMEEFDDICEDMTATEIACKCIYGEFNPNHDYFKFNGYENFESSDYLTDLIYIDDLADYIVRNEETFDNDDLQEYFDELEEDEEDED